MVLTAHLSRPGGGGVGVRGMRPVEHMPDEAVEAVGMCVRICACVRGCSWCEDVSVWYACLGGRGYDGEEHGINARLWDARKLMYLISSMY